MVNVGMQCRYQVHSCRIVVSVSMPYTPTNKNLSYCHETMFSLALCAAWLCSDRRHVHNTSLNFLNLELLTSWTGLRPKHMSMYRHNQHTRAGAHAHRQYVQNGVQSHSIWKEKKAHEDQTLRGKVIRFIFVYVIILMGRPWFCC